ncbi:MAG: 50S ribosomal protein L31e [archaeon]
MERKYIIPLRKEWLKVPIYKRSKKAGAALKQFLQKHMKVEDVKIGKYLNQAIWARGMKKPPHKIEVLATKVEEKDRTYVFAELPDAPKEEVKVTGTKKKSKKIADKIKDALKAPEDKEKKEEREKEKLLEKEFQEKTEKMKKPAKKHKAEEKKDHKKELIGHTGKSKDGVETTGR